MTSIAVNLFACGDVPAFESCVPAATERKSLVSVEDMAKLYNKNWIMLGFLMH